MPDTAPEGLSEGDQVELDQLREELGGYRDRLAEVLLHRDEAVSQLQAQRQARADAEQALARASADRDRLLAMVDQLDARVGELSAAFDAQVARPAPVSAARRDAFIDAAQRAARPPLTEAEVRAEVDTMLTAAGWLVQDAAAANLFAGPGDSPFMDSLIFVIMLIFLVAGVCYGAAAGTLTGSAATMAAITKTFANLGGLIFLLLVIAQFIAYFNYTNMATVAAVTLADPLENANVGAIWLLAGLIIVTMIINLIIPGVIPKWAILAPVFIPLFLRLDVAPQTVLAAYRVGDSPTNVITPLMVYLPFIVLLAQKYKKDAGVGTVVSLMIPYTIVVAIAWTVFFIAWFLLGIPLGTGAPVEAN